MPPTCHFPSQNNTEDGADQVLMLLPLPFLLPSLRLLNHNARSI